MSENPRNRDAKHYLIQRRCYRVPGTAREMKFIGTQGRTATGNETYTRTAVYWYIQGYQMKSNSGKCDIKRKTSSFIVFV